MNSTTFTGHKIAANMTPQQTHTHTQKKKNMKKNKTNCSLGSSALKQHTTRDSASLDTFKSALNTQSF